MTAVPGGEGEPAARRATEEYLRKKAQLMEVENLGWSVEVRTGAAAEEALASIRENRIDAVALTTHGRTGAARALYGSVAERILLHAEAPLLVVANRVAQRRTPIMPASGIRKE
jgi:nucleotide-binding universal stress UspA family protein